MEAVDWFTYKLIARLLCKHWVRFVWHTANLWGKCRQTVYTRKKANTRLLINIK